MAMTERQIDGQYAYGWRFGLGFGAAATVWLIVWFVLAMAAARMAFDSSQKNVRAISKAIAPKVLQAAPKVIAPRQQVIQIPPQSKEACFEESAGVINEQFQQCVSGYSYTVTE